MTNNLVVDSTVFVSALGKPDVFSTNSKRFFKRLLGSDRLLIVPTLVIAETINTIQKQKKPFSHLLSYFSGFTIIVLDNQFIQDFSKSLKGTSLKTADAIIAVTAEIHKAKLITWDHMLLSPANIICQALTPMKFLQQEQEMPP